LLYDFLTLTQAIFDENLSDRSRSENTLPILDGFFADVVVDPFQAKITPNLYCESFCRGAESRDRNGQFQERIHITRSFRQLQC
jgi:hypothetical protein